MAFELGTDGPMVIVVGVDGSPPSLRAGAYAAGLARRQGSRLVAVHVVTGSRLAALSPAAQGALLQGDDDLTRQLAHEVEEGARSIGLEADFVVVHGDAYLELTRVARERRADAVVVGASSQAGHRLVGSLAVRLVRSGHWPVTVVP